MGSNAIVGMLYLCNSNDRIAWFNWLEGDGYFVKFYCINAYIKYGNEYSFNCKVSSVEKRISTFTKKEAVFEACKKMILPILYTVLTTICAFLSLVFSGIKPIIDFGWMMTLGLIVSLFVTFLLLPALINLLSTDDEIDIKNTEKSFITSALGSFTKNSKTLIFSTTFVIIVFSIVGIFKLEVENSFINYFDKETDL